MNWRKKEVPIFATFNEVNRAAAKDTLLLQLLLVLLTSMILDGGATLQMVLLACLGWWVGLFCILVFHARQQNATDTLFLKYGFWPLLLISFTATGLWGGVWRN